MPASTKSSLIWLKYLLGHFKQKRRKENGLQREVAISVFRR